MIFKYLEDYENLKILNKLIENIHSILNSERKLTLLNSVTELEELENFVEKKFCGKKKYFSKS